MNRVKWTFLLLATLLLGICAGMLGTHQIIKHQFDRIAREGPQAIPSLLTRQLAWRLDLTSAQQQTIEPILRSAQGEFQAVRRQYEPQLVTVVSQAIADIQITLTDEQRLQFKALLDFQRSRWLLTQDAALAAKATP